jgi:hypothetical protein
MCEADPGCPCGEDNYDCGCLECAARDEEIDNLKALLVDVANAGLVFSDPRVSYVEIQIDAETWIELQRIKKEAGK